MPWYRVFCASDTIPAPADLEAVAVGAGLSVSLEAAQEAEQWFWLRLQMGDEALEISRFLSDEEGIRVELNSWAAFLESCSEGPEHAALMERTIQSRQLFYFECSRMSPFADVAVRLCKRLATIAEGFYQIDDEGFFAADGSLLVAEPHEQP